MRFSVRIHTEGQPGVKDYSPIIAGGKGRQWLHFLGQRPMEPSGTLGAFIPAGQRERQRERHHGAHGAARERHVHGGHIPRRHRHVHHGGHIPRRLCVFRRVEGNARSSSTGSEAGGHAAIATTLTGVPAAPLPRRDSIGSADGSPADSGVLVSPRAAEAFCWASAASATAKSIPSSSQEGPKAGATMPVWSAARSDTPKHRVRDCARRSM
jgi:hypothetical protein